MKRLILSALAFSMLAIPVAHADYRPAQNGEYRMVQKFDGKPRDVRRVEKKVIVKRNGQKVVVKKVRHGHWVRGNRVPDWNRRYVVRDYHSHGLRRPAYGQRWIKVDNDYLLISITTGIVASIIAGH